MPGLPHHVTQRGNRREVVFFDDDDRRHFLDLLSRYAARTGLSIHAYCLMPNHVHLVVVPTTEASLASCLGPVHLRYAQHLNRKQGVAGRVWQGRFYSCPLDEAHFVEAVRYVELNPVRAGLVGRAEEYPWSSAAAHAAGVADGLLADIAELRDSVGDWSTWLRQPLAEDRLGAIRRGTMTGRPAGDAEFVTRLGERLGRRLTSRPAGRPRRRKDGDGE